MASTTHSIWKPVTLAPPSSPPQEEEEEEDSLLVLGPHLTSTLPGFSPRRISGAERGALGLVDPSVFTGTCSNKQQCSDSSRDGQAG
jgi:hypothetical protein